MYKTLLHKKASRYYESLNDKKTKRINKAIDSMAKDPFQGVHIKKLKGKMEGKYRYAVGELRIVYNINVDGKTILVEAIGPRGNVYKS